MVVFAEARLNCSLFPSYIDTRANHLADSLSRNINSHFFSQVQSADKQPTPVSAHSSLSPLQSQPTPSLSPLPVSAHSSLSPLPVSAHSSLSPLQSQPTPVSAHSQSQPTPVSAHSQSQPTPVSAHSSLSPLQSQPTPSLSPLQSQPTSVSAQLVDLLLNQEADWSSPTWRRHFGAIFRQA